MPTSTASSRPATSSRNSRDVSPRRAGALRALARQGSAVDAIVVALAEPGGAVLTSDLKDLRALATHADAVHIYRA